MLVYHLKTNTIHHVKEIQEKNHVMRSIDAEKSFERSQHTLRTTLRKPDEVCTHKNPTTTILTVKGCVP